MAWSQHDAPDQTGKLFVVTGGNSGLGLEVSKMLAAKGARLILACRDAAKAEAAATQVRSLTPTAQVEVMPLDVSSLASVRAFATALLEKKVAVDGLINNAGIMAVPYAKTADGFELQLGTNHLGHFALTGLVLEALERAPAARVVSLGSNAHWVGKINFDDLQSERAYSPSMAYCQSKLANLLFMAELERRLRAKGRKTIAVACHPGYAATELQHVGPRLANSSFSAFIMSVGNSTVAQSAMSGALPTLYAATAPDVHGGEYFGPRVLAFWGAPTRATPVSAARDEATAKRLWEVSEQLTGVHFPS